MKRSTALILIIASVAMITCVLVALCAVIVGVSDNKEASIKTSPYDMPKHNNSLPPPVKGEGWNNKIVHNLCLDVNQVYPGLSGVRALPLHEAITATLNKSGITVVDEEQSCEATLLIDFEVYAVSGVYEVVGKCYTGAEVKGKMVLSSPGNPSLSVPLNYEKSPSEAVSDNCAKTKEIGVGNVLYSGKFATNVIAGLYSFWGSEVAVWALNDNFLRLRVVNFIHVSNNEVKSEFASQLVLVMLYGQNRDARRAALVQLGQVGPGAKQAVPVLINILEDEDLQQELLDYPISDRNRAEEAIVEVLNKITGINFGTDAVEWRSWWDSQ